MFLMAGDFNETKNKICDLLKASTEQKSYSFLDSF